MQLAVDGPHRWSLGFGIPLPLDQLSPDLGGTQSRVEAIGAEARIGLTLAIDEGLEVVQKMGVMIFGPPSSAQGEGIHTGNPGLDFVHPFDQGVAIPTQFPLGTSSPTVAQEEDRASHKLASLATLQCLGCVEEMTFDCFRKV
jgi:hypothetical protein